MPKKEPKRDTFFDSPKFDELAEFSDFPLDPQLFLPYEIDLINLLEQKFLLSGVIPSKEYCERIGICSPEQFNAAFEKEHFRGALYDRGITFRQAGDLEDDEVLTPEQLAACNLILDYSDTRTRTNKLKSINVTTQKWNAWNKDPSFAKYLRDRAEGVVGNIHESHISLLAAVQKGDMSAVKLHYEVTGRYNSRAEGMDLQAFMVTVLTVLQQTIPDANLLNLVAVRLGAVLTGGKNAPPILEGVVLLESDTVRAPEFNSTSDVGSDRGIQAEGGKPLITPDSGGAPERNGMRVWD